MAQTVKIGGATYEGVPSITTTDGSGGAASFVDTSGATAAAGEILAGKKAFVQGAEVVGSMADRGAVSGAISTKAGTYTVAAGYHNGSGKVQISSTEQAKVIAGNIRSGVTLLGVAGSPAVVNTSDGTAGAGDIVSGKTAYVNGAKVTGTYAPPTGYQVATGRIVYTSTSNNKIDVTGLPFSPVGAIVLKQNNARTSGNVLGVASESIYTADEGTTVYGINQTTGTSTTLVNTGIPLTLDANGFHRHPSGTTYKVYGYYYYVAWG